MRRNSLLPLFLAGCAGNFSVQLDGSSDSGTSSDSSTSAPTDDNSSGTDTTSAPSADTTSESGSSDPDSSSSSAGSTGSCTEIETCVPCGNFEQPDAACAQAFPDRPVCDTVSGSCVQCSEEDVSECGDMTPVCSAGACVGCTFHEQCPGTACEVSTGACFDGLCVREVDGDGGEAYSTISSALADGCVVIVHERNGDAPYTESLVIDGLTVAILAASGEDPILQGIGGNPSILVDVGATAFLMGMRIRGNTGAEGLSVNDGAAYVDNTQIVQNSGGGVVATGGELHLRNSFVGGNGGNGFSNTTGLLLTGVEVEMSYASVIFNEGDAADSFQCSATTGTLRNSIVLGSNPSSFDCPGLSANHTAFDDVIAGMGNEDVSPAIGAWFINPVSDFHLTNSGESVFSTVAQWEDGDPTTDIDTTEVRVNTPRSPDVAGADVPP